MNIINILSVIQYLSLASFLVFVWYYFPKKISKLNIEFEKQTIDFEKQLLKIEDQEAKIDELLTIVNPFSGNKLIS